MAMYADATREPTDLHAHSQIAPLLAHIWKQQDYEETVSYKRPRYGS